MTSPSDSTNSLSSRDAPVRARHNHYHKSVEGLDFVDVYRVLKLFNVTDPCIQHAVKKLLVAGGRGAGKDVSKDIQESIDSLVRWQEMRKEEDRLTVAPQYRDWRAEVDVEKLTGIPHVDLIPILGKEGWKHRPPCACTTHCHSSTKPADSVCRGLPCEIDVGAFLKPSNVVNPAPNQAERIAVTFTVNGQGQYGVHGHAYQPGRVLVKAADIYQAYPWLQPGHWLVTKMSTGHDLSICKDGSVEQFIQLNEDGSTDLFTRVIR